jgi:hypothetical protein
VSSPPKVAPVAFGLTTPLLAGLRRIVRRPGSTLLPVVVLLLPLVPVVLAIAGVLRAGADVALTELIAGAPADATGAVIVRPDGFGVRLLVALAGLLVIAGGIVAAAGLVAGAATAGSSGPGDALRRAWRAWPGVALSIVLGALVTGVAAAVVVTVAVLAGHLRFQLTGVVLVLGLGALAVVLVRLSLWPAIALADDASLVGALRRAWSGTRGHVIRLVLASVVVVLGLALPTAVVGLVVTGVLDAFADAEVLDLSPVAFGLWSLALVPVAVLLGTVIWGLGARSTAVAIGAIGASPAPRATEPAHPRSASLIRRAGPGDAVPRG